MHTTLHLALLFFGHLPQMLLELYLYPASAWFRFDYKVYPVDGNVFLISLPPFFLAVIRDFSVKYYQRRMIRKQHVSVCICTYSRSLRSCSLSRCARWNIALSCDDRISYIVDVVIEYTNTLCVLCVVLSVYKTFKVPEI